MSSDSINNFETSREYFSISTFSRKHWASFDNVLILHKLYKLVWLTGTIFQRLHTRQSGILPVFPPKFPFCTCWAVGVEVPFDAKTNTMCNLCHATEALHRKLRSITPCGGLSPTNAQSFCSYLYYFAEAIVEAWSSKIAWYFYTDSSVGANGNFGGKTGRIPDCRVCSL